MTTKIKIISGFVCMVTLLAVIAVIGFVSLQRTSNEIREFDRIAKLNTQTSNLEVALFRLEDNVYQYLDSRDLEHMSVAFLAREDALKVIGAAEGTVRKPNRVEELRGIKADVTALRSIMEKVQAGGQEAYKQYVDVVQPAGRGMLAKLLALSRLTADTRNIEAGLVAAESLGGLASVRSALGRFGENRLPEDATKVTNYLANLQKSLKDLSPLLQTEQDKQLYREILNIFGVLSSSFQTMKERFASVEQNLQTIEQTLVKVLNISRALNKEVDSEATAAEENMLANISSAQWQVSFIGALGLVGGIVVALLIVLGIVRVLRELGAYASAIAHGDFQHVVTVREKGEIGEMIEGMRQIPRTLNSIIEKAGELADAVASGRLREKLEPNGFPGSFSGIAVGVNVVSASYVGLLDALELPILGGDRENKIIYLNRAAQKALGGNFVNDPCRSHINSPECGGKDCIGNCSMSKNGMHNGDTTLSLRGKRMEASVFAFPLHNLKKETVGFMEIITDLTEMKDRQAAVLRAVSEASGISDRVAAASEQLSAQVEEISRGAEVQRDRVNSTATAMEEMNATVLEVARSAGQASEQSENTRNRAQEGASLVNSVVGSINQVNTVAVALQGNMQELGKQAEGIGGVINVISDIADQTNLLALNAAIEAARAGEAGRGFAVVADEVRKLAEKTMHATKEVEVNISAIQQSAGVSINEVNNAVKSISEATALADSSGSALQEIVSLAASNSSVVASIATAAEQQSATSEEINRSIDEINRIAGETTIGMVQSSSAVQELSRMAQELRHVMDRLAKPAIA